MIINIRGTNGSGKTTLARALIGADPQPVDLIRYNAPTKRDPQRRLAVEGYGRPGGFLAIGSYKQGCGGMDTIPSFDLQHQAIRKAYDWDGMAGERPRHVVCEGVLASTVFGSWGNFFSGFNKDEVLIAYLDTPLEVCLERIRERQIAAKGEAREIKTDLVANKVKAIEATRKRFDAAGFHTVGIGYRHALDEILYYLGETL